MSEARATFGVQLAQVETIDARLALESQLQKRATFSAVDRALSSLIACALRGERIADVVPAKNKSERDRVLLTQAPSADEIAAIDEHFRVANQEKRGSWHVPNDEPISLGLMHAVYWRKQNERFFIGLANRDTVNPLFADAPEAVALWTLEPLFEDLFMPLKLRSGFGLGKKSIEQQLKYWQAIDPLYAALGFGEPALSDFRPQTGWSEISTDEIIARRLRLMDSWATAPENAGDRYRVFRVGELIDRYYAKAKNGQATRKQVLTKAFGRTLTAFFGGDWLAFLAYIGEQPHESEELITELPETRLIVGASDRTAAVATEVGVPAQDIEKMLASFWGQADHKSPVERRLEALGRYWKEFDAAHASQEPGMESLWGFIDEGRFYVRPFNAAGYVPNSYKSRLPRDFLDDVEALWGTTALAKFPDRIVSEPFPHHSMSKSFGPALDLWHGIGLTAWFICEGPISRTDIDGMPEYYAKQIAELDRLGFPIDPEMFSQLSKVRSKLKKTEPLNQQRSVSSSGGVSITMSTSFGERLKGFEKLRDVITSHRRQWAASYLDSYLQSFCENELREAGTEFSRSSAQRGKEPTLKMFAKHALPPAQHWFAGDIAKVYAAIGVKGPEVVRNELLLPSDVERFVLDVFHRLGGEDFDDSNRMMGSHEEIREFREKREQLSHFGGLAEKAPLFVQVSEALGRRPELKEFGRANFAVSRDLPDDSVEQMWQEFGDTIEEALAAPAHKEPVSANESASDLTDAETQDASSEASAIPPSWHPDPISEFAWRWWDGGKWSQHVSDSGEVPSGEPESIEFRGVYYSAILDDETCAACRAADEIALRRLDDKTRVSAPHPACTSSRGCCCSDVFVYLSEKPSHDGYTWAPESQRLNKLLGEP